MAFLFGLLHGAGLAGGLQQLGLPRGETLQALVLLLARLWRRRRLPTPLWLRRLPGYAVGSFGAYRAIERTMAMVAGGG